VLRKIAFVNPVLNISAYHFVALNDTAALREGMRSQALANGLKGTVLIAEEGINLVLAGQAENVQRFLDTLQHDDRFAAMPIKRSQSPQVPFRKLVVKVKREIIRMNHPAIQPQAGRAAAVDARTLARWLRAGRDDEGREVVTLDTRNAFEVDQRRFQGALDWRIVKFSDFPQAMLAHRDELRGKTVVSYCTGGIRCEKAALFMREAGIDHVLQLEGGLLRYFEDSGGEHFDGHCFVFDERVALDARLDPRE
jgi:UPF0176 protein